MLEPPTAVHCCDPALSVLVMLVSRNVFHLVSALQSIACLYLKQSLVFNASASTTASNQVKTKFHANASTSKINRPFSTRRVKCGKYVRKHRDFQRRLSSAELFLPCFCCPNSLQCIGFPNFELLTYLLCYLLDQKYLSQKKIAPVDETSISP